eukprot:354895-Chlamydomonas_euryale.AAC.6
MPLDAHCDPCAASILKIVPACDGARSPAVKEWEKQYQPPVIHLGRVLSVGDGIARVYGLKSVQVGAHAWNTRTHLLTDLGDRARGARVRSTDDVARPCCSVMPALPYRPASWCASTAADAEIHQGDLVYRTGQIVNVPIGPGTLGRVMDALGQPIDGKGPLTNVRSSLVEVKAPGELQAKSCACCHG